MKMNKDKFLKTELGHGLDICIRTWDKALDNQRKYLRGTIPYVDEKKVANWCQAQWEVYKIAIKQFFGVEYFFTRTDEYFGLVTEDETDWLIKINR